MSAIPHQYEDLGLPVLPIDDCLDELLAVLEKDHAAVLVAPPGAGKTTRVPLAVLGANWLSGRKIIMLEPRRLAVRAAASHMAGLLGEQVGQTVGYRVRMESRTSSETRIEIITEGVFTRMILDDPELTGIGAVLFDEFHERSLDGDLGLALALECASVFRKDLRLLPMSATMDGAKVSSLLESRNGQPARVVESKGQSFPVDILYQPRKPDETVQQAMVAAIRRNIFTHAGSLLCFLPGQKEIEQVYQSLGDLPDNVKVHRLYGALDQEEQSAAISKPHAGSRKIVLASSIAETSITIDGVTMVIDSGLSRAPVYEPSIGITRLATVKSSRASIAQRAGRAGRTAPGTALRLWHEGQNGSLPDYDRPEIMDADLTGLVLDLAVWGVCDPDQLKWQNPPPEPAWKEAVHLLSSLGALDSEGRITGRGKQIRSLALPPRLAHMVLHAAESEDSLKAAMLAVLITERGLGGRSVDLEERLTRLRSEKSKRAKAARNLAARIASGVGIKNRQGDDTCSIGQLISIAWPERIAQKVSNDTNNLAVYRLANGRRARLDSFSQLAKCPFIAIAEVQGSASTARILSAATLAIDDLRTDHGLAISIERNGRIDPETGKFQVTRQERMGALVLTSSNVPPDPEDDIPTALIKHLHEKGLEQLFRSQEVHEFRQRAHFLHMHEPEKVPAFTFDALESDLEAWLLPVITDARGLDDITPAKLINGLTLRLGYENSQRLDKLAPRKFELPSGVSHKLEYGADEIILRARVQEFFSMAEHPALPGGSIPLTLEFLSPAMRPIQKTRDIAGFWKGSWHDVRKEMKGRYPKHYWPEDPVSSLPTTRTKPR